MSLTNQAETAFLSLFLLNAAWPGIGDAAGLQPSAVAGSFYVGLGDADPGEAATGQDASEIAYTGYGRAAIARAGAAFSVVGNIGENVVEVNLGTCTAAAPANPANHLLFGTAAAGTGYLILSAALTVPLPITVNVTPRFAPSDLQILID